MLEKPTECLVHVGDHCQYQDKQTHSESVLIGSGGGFVALCLIIQWVHIDSISPLKTQALWWKNWGFVFRRHCERGVEVVEVVKVVKVVTRMVVA